jgi:hypothetical protein
VAEMTPFSSSTKLTAEFMNKIDKRDSRPQRYVPLRPRSTWNCRKRFPKGCLLNRLPVFATGATLAKSEWFGI